MAKDNNKRNLFHEDIEERDIDIYGDADTNEEHRFHANSGKKMSQNHQDLAKRDSGKRASTQNNYNTVGKAKQTDKHAAHESSVEKRASNKSSYDHGGPVIGHRKNVSSSTSQSHPANKKSRS